MTSLIEQDLAEALQTGNYYEAYQLYASISQRLVKQKKESEALALLTSGIRALTEAGQAKSAADLCAKALSCLSSSAKPWTPACSQACIRILESLPFPSSMSQKWILDSTRLSQSLGQGQVASDYLLALAQAYARIDDTEMTLTYYTQAGSLLAKGPLLAYMKAQLAPSSAFLACMTSAILKQLKMRQHQWAYDLSTELLEELRARGLAMTRQDYETIGLVASIWISEEQALVQFCQLIIQVTQRSGTQGRALFLDLESQYQTQLNETQREEMHELEKIYFSKVNERPSASSASHSNNNSNSSNNNSQPPSMNPADLLSSVMRGLFANRPGSSGPASGPSSNNSNNNNNSNSNNRRSNPSSNFFPDLD